jgi:hypothetical protein
MKSDQPKFDDRMHRIPRAYQLPDRPLRSLGADETPGIGAHLITPWLGFAHHGIYVGDGKVVHYGALVYDIVRRPVEEVTLASFAEGRCVFVVDHAAATYTGADVILRARSRLGEDRYRVLTNNCEHFVEWCMYGVARSFQVATALAFPFVLGEWLQWKLRRFALRLFGRRPFAARIKAPIPAAVPEQK